MNAFGTIVMYLKPHSTFDKALVDVKKTFEVLKTSLNPFGTLYATKISVLFPFTLPKIVCDDISDKFSIVFSNLNASKTNYVYDGKVCTSHFFIAPGVNKMYTGIGYSTMADNMAMSIFSDSAMLSNP